MTNLLLVLSKDPYTTEIPNLVLDIGLNARTKKGSGVSLYLVEDGVTAARKSEFGNKLLDTKKKGSGSLPMIKQFNQEDLMVT